MYLSLLKWSYLAKPVDISVYTHWGQTHSRAAIFCSKKNKMDLCKWVRTVTIESSERHAQWCKPESSPLRFASLPSLFFHSPCFPIPPLVLSLFLFLSICASAWGLVIWLSLITSLHAVHSEAINIASLMKTFRGQSALGENVCVFSLSVLLKPREPSASSLRAEYTPRISSITLPASILPPSISVILSLFTPGAVVCLQKTHREWVKLNKAWIYTQNPIHYQYFKPLNHGNENEWYIMVLLWTIHQ